MTIRYQRQSQRRRTAAAWTSLNEVLLPGEIGVEEHALPATDRLKIGDGVTAWNSLPYSTDGQQPLDSDLTAIAALSPSNDSVLQRKAGAWTSRTPAQLAADLAITDSGTCTPFYSGSLTDPVVSVWARQVGNWSRNGKVMTVVVELQPTTITTPGTGNMFIGGLPTAAASGVRYVGGVNVHVATGFTTDRPIGGYIFNGGTRAQMQQAHATTPTINTANIPVANATSGSLLIATITYLLP